MGKGGQGLQKVRLSFEYDEKTLTKEKAYKNFI